MALGVSIREEHRLRVSGNMVLRGMFAPKGEEVTGSWTELYNEELHNLYSSPNIARNIKSRGLSWAGHVVCSVQRRNVYKALADKKKKKITREIQA
jgi:hypothetical protein